MADAGRWDQRPLVREIEQRKFWLILMTMNFAHWTREELTAVTTYY